MQKIIIKTIKLYQYLISPAYAPCCRFIPSCSAYTVEAIEKYGALKGLGLGVKRVCKCQPFSKGGLDPVPD